MHGVRLLSVLVRSAILWAGIVLCGVGSVRAQERVSIDTLHLFNTHTDTVWLSFDEVLPLSATGNTKFHYLYRWTSNGKKVGEKNILNYSFTGDRKAKVKGQRFSFPYSWPGEEYIDIEYLKNIDYLAWNPQDTLYLKAFSEYESDSTAKWIWTMGAWGEDTLFGPRIKYTFSSIIGEFFVSCTLLTGTEEKYTRAYISSKGGLGYPSIRLTDSIGGNTYSIDLLGEPDVIYAHTDDTLYLGSRKVPL